MLSLSLSHSHSRFLFHLHFNFAPIFVLPFRSIYNVSFPFPKTFFFKKKKKKKPQHPNRLVLEQSSVFSIHEPPYRKFDVGFHLIFLHFNTWNDQLCSCVYLYTLLTTIIRLTVSLYHLLPIVNAHTHTHTHSACQMLFTSFLSLNIPIHFFLRILLLLLLPPPPLPPLRLVFSLLWYICSFISIKWSDGDEIDCQEGKRGAWRVWEWVVVLVCSSNF